MASFLTVVGLAGLGVIVFQNAFGAFSAWLQAHFATCISVKLNLR